MKSRSFKTITSLILTVLMIFSIVGLGAYADATTEAPVAGDGFAEGSVANPAKGPATLSVTADDETPMPSDDGESLSPIDLEVNLVWIGVPADVLVPRVDLQLVRTVSQSGIFEDVGESVALTAPATTHTYSVDPGNPAYTYTLRLTNFDDFSDNYTFKLGLSERLFTLSITYKEKINLTGEVVWLGGPNKPSTLSVQLYRNSSPLKALNIEQSEIAATDSGWKGTALFEGLEKYDEAGKEYVYTLDSGPGHLYTKVAEGMKITYTFIKIPKTVRITKIWKGGPGEKPDATIYLDLKRNSTIVKTETVLFTDPTPVGLVDGVETWSETISVTMDVEGLSSYSFVTRENPVASYKSVKTGNWVNGFTVTNIYRSDITATKIWVGGFQPRPEVKFKLMRQAGTAGPKQQVGYLKTLASGTTECTWTGAGTEIINDAGVPYRYWVEETTVLEAYQKLEEGLTVTNTYVPGIESFTAKKVWEDNDNAFGLRPLSVTLALFNAQGNQIGEAQDVPAATDASNESAAVFLFDPYAYDSEDLLVKEIGYTDLTGEYHAFGEGLTNVPGYWESDEDGRTLINHLDTGVLTIEKEFTGSAVNANPSFTVTGATYGITRTVNLSDFEEGEAGVKTLTLTLPMDSYTVTETDADVGGYTRSTKWAVIGWQPIAAFAESGEPEFADGTEATLELNQQNYVIFVNNYAPNYYPPNPSPSVPPTTEIPEELPPLNPGPDPEIDVPEIDNPEIDVPEVDIPLAPAPVGTVIPEAETPLDAAPQTGDTSKTVPLAILALLSVIGIAALSFLGKKKKHN